MRIEYLWFQDCPNHEETRAVLMDVLRSRQVSTEIEDIDASDDQIARTHRFPGSPTIRIDGSDVEPDFVDPGDYSPRCRVYFTGAGFAGQPPRKWIEAAVDRARE